MQSCQPIKRLKDKKKNYLSDTLSIVSLYTSVCKNLQFFWNFLRSPEHVVDYLRTIMDFSQKTLYCVRFILYNATKKSPHLLKSRCSNQMKCHALFSSDSPPKFRYITLNKPRILPSKCFWIHHWFENMYLESQKGHHEVTPMNTL
jgi:hypothetical protein